MAYWGDLESPISRQNSIRRNSSESHNVQQSQYPPQQNAQARQNRTSTQSQAPTVSTQSPFVSPTASSFKGDGLAPRPPSFPYGVPGGYSKDYLDKRRRRASREAEEYSNDSENTVPPPAAPDAPRFPPSVSYKKPSSSTAPPANYPPPVTSRSTRRQDGSVNANQIGAADSYRDRRTEAKASRPAVEKGELSINTDYRREKRDRNPIEGAPDQPRDYADKSVIRRGTVGARKERPEYHDPAPPPRSRQASAAETEAQRRREWAPDRSPLQRLELTLDSITKEEKRARVEEAELLAREAKAGRGGDRLNQNSVRFKNRPIAKTEAPGQAEPQSLAEAGLVRSLSNKQKDELQRSGTLERKKPVAADSAPTQQLGKGFEYQPQRESTSAVREPEKTPLPQRETVSTTRAPEKASVPKRGPSFRERAAAPAVAGAIAGAALSRSTSNKLKKEPPGDPWFNRRLEAERAYPEITPRRPSVDARRDPNTMIGGPLGSAPVALSARKVTDDTRKEESKSHPVTRPVETVSKLSEKDLPQPASVPRNPSRKIEQSTGYQGGNELPRPMSPQQQQLYADRLGLSAELGPESGRQQGPLQSRAEIKSINGIKHAVAPEVAAGNNGQERATQGPNGHYHLSDIAHNRRSQYRPGDGLYVPHQPLEEWKNGAVGALTGTLLDLEVRRTEAENDKAWWEAGHSGKRKTSLSKKPRIETYDSEYENNNGMVLPNLSNSEESYALFVSVAGAQAWSKIKETVVPCARHIIGYTGNGNAEKHRRNEFWLMKKNSLPARPMWKLEVRGFMRPLSFFIFSPLFI